MSNTADKLAIANIGLLSVGQSTLSSLDPTTPNANKIVLVFEDIVAELLADDWCFNRKRVRLTDLVAVNLLTVSDAAAPGTFLVGSTLTGASSHFTATVVEVRSSTVYLVTQPTGAFIVGETLSDGTNSAAYLSITDQLEVGVYDSGFVLPGDFLYIRGIAFDDFNRKHFPYTVEGNVLFTFSDVEDIYLHYNKWIGYLGSADVSDITVMPRWFHRLVSSRISHILSPNITQQTNRETKAQAEYREAYLNAKEQNGNELYNRYERGSPSWATAANIKLDSLSNTF